MKKRQRTKKQVGDQKLIARENTPSIEVSMFGVKGIGQLGVIATVIIIGLITFAAIFDVGPWK